MHCFFKGVDELSQKYVVVDLETTGNTYYKGDRIFQISAVTVENNKIIDQYTSFVNPGVPIPPFIEELTGINDEMVADAPSFDEISEIINGLLVDSIFVAHNVSFDLGFLEGELQESGYNRIETNSIDTVELAKILFPSSQSFKLNELAEMLDLSHDNPHQADSDALVTAELLLIMLDNGETTAACNFGEAS